MSLCFAAPLLHPPPVSTRTFLDDRTPVIRKISNIVQDSGFSRSVDKKIGKVIMKSK